MSCLDCEVGCGLEGGDVDGYGAGVGEGDGLGGCGIAYLRCREGEGALRGGVGDERCGVRWDAGGDGGRGASEVDEIGAAESVAFDD